LLRMHCNRNIPEKFVSNSPLVNLLTCLPLLCCLLLCLGVAQPRYCLAAVLNAELARENSRPASTVHFA
jgi:hypothetical protein